MDRRGIRVDGAELYDRKRPARLHVGHVDALSRAIMLDPRQTAPRDTRGPKCLGSQRFRLTAPGRWVGNALRFATKEEAEGNVLAFAMRWASRVVECDEPVNYRWVNGRMIDVEAQL
jgi:hypothetical protein